MKGSTKWLEELWAMPSNRTTIRNKEQGSYCFTMYKSDVKSVASLCGHVTGETITYRWKRGRDDLASYDFVSIYDSEKVSILHNSIWQSPITIFILLVASLFFFPYSSLIWGELSPTQTFAKWCAFNWWELYNELDSTLSSMLAFFANANAF